MANHTTDRLHFNFGYLLADNPGESRIVELDYPSVKLDEVYLEPLTGKFRASRTARGIFLKGKLRSIMEIDCARCSHPFKSPVDLLLNDHYYLKADAPEGEFIIPESGKLDLGPLVRELAITAVPMQPICKEDCAGLCVTCGINLNETTCDCEDDDIDPRFAILKQLLESEE